MSADGTLRAYGAEGGSNVWAIGNLPCRQTQSLVRYQGLEQRSREVPVLAAESNTVRVLTPCQPVRYHLRGACRPEREGRIFP
jgi:hypothetical protein